MNLDLKDKVVKSICFSKKDEVIVKYLEGINNFSYYVKGLIKKDMDSSSSALSDDIKKQIKYFVIELLSEQDINLKKQNNNSNVHNKELISALDEILK